MWENTQIQCRQCHIGLSLKLSQDASFKLQPDCRVIDPTTLVFTINGDSFLIYSIQRVSVLCVSNLYRYSIDLRSKTAVQLRIVNKEKLVNGAGGHFLN